MYCKIQHLPVDICQPGSHRVSPRSRGIVRKLLLAVGVLAALHSTLTQTTYAQTRTRGRYLPLDQTVPPGMAGKWAGAQRGFVPVLQAVRVDAPQGGKVSYYTSPAAESVETESSAVVALQVGSVYRLKISEMPEYPGVELFPTVELIDRLHPPAGRETEFPVPIALTDEEISLAVSGRLVTKVVYLEQPDRADPIRRTDAARSEIAHPRENLLALADEKGRPMAIVRIGGREPDAGAINSGFYGVGAPVQLLKPATRSPKVVNP
ncbi:MAG: hypothetical protein JSS02_08200 [Planctomycetes bacterium]|nr:hypothetical protein [Planctomycetota bacterium]